MIKEQVDLFKKIIGLSQTGLLKTMAKYLKNNYSDVDWCKDYVYAKGDVPVMVVAHLDTVFSELPTNVYFDSEKLVMWSPEGLGADDRAGVLGIICLIKRGLRPHVLLLTDEEVGGIGASRFIHDYNDCPDVRYVIELDRQGLDDCVFYDCHNKKFTKYVEKFGFKTQIGSFSDISILCPNWGIAGVNLSIGYMDEHSYVETFFLNAFNSTLDKVERMIKDCVNLEENFKFIKQKRRHYLNGYKCHCCKGYFQRDEIFDVQVKTNNKAGFAYRRYCIDCAVKEEIEWCKTCGTPYLKENDEVNCFKCAGGRIDV